MAIIETNGFLTTRDPFVRIEPHVFLKKSGLVCEWTWDERGRTVTIYVPVTSLKKAMESYPGCPVVSPITHHNLRAWEYGRETSEYCTNYLGSLATWRSHARRVDCDWEEHIKLLKCGVVLGEDQFRAEIDYHFDAAHREMVPYNIRKAWKAQWGEIWETNSHYRGLRGTPSNCY